MLENNCDFPKVEEKFCVIESDTITVVIPAFLAEQIKAGYGNWRDIQKYSVSIYKSKKNKWKIRQIAEDIYQWTLPYDSFLGIYGRRAETGKVKSRKLRTRQLYTRK